MSKKFLWYGVALGCLVALLAAPVAQAQTCGPLNNGRLANVFHEGTALFFEPVVEYRTMTLTIGGPCEDIVKVFGPKDQISFDIREIERITDGQYTWQLHREATVDPSVQKELEASRGSGKEDDVWWSFWQKGLIPEGPYMDSGYFAVERGQIIGPDSGQEKSASLAGKGSGTGASSGLQAALAGALGSGDAFGDSGEPVLSTKDTVLTNANGVIRNSLCVGFDCLNNNTYSDTTILLTENNTRIKFDDTSTISGFPNRDWEIEANSSLSGGQSYLGFNDCGTSSGGGCASDLVFAVEANVRQHALYVESDGDVGLGTNNPVVRLHMIDGDTPALRLEQDGSSGFQPQVWDVAGNETNFFVRDATGGSTLPFRIRPGAPSNSIFIDSDGDVGIGTSSPAADADMTIESGESVAILMRKAATVRFRLNNTAAGSQWDTNNDGSGNYAISLVGSGQNELVIAQDGNIGNCNNPDHDFVISTGPGCTATPRSWIDAGDTSFSITSSRAFKQNLQPVEVPEILERIRNIHVYEYDFVEGPEDRIGLIAEDFHQVFGRGSDTELSGHEVQLAMWLAIQELDQRDQKIEEKNSEIEDLKSRLQALERLVETLATDR